MTDGEVRAWAWTRVGLEASPSQEVLELASDGPTTCLKRSSADFPPRHVELNYEQEFSLRAVRTALDSEDSILDLAKWAAKRAMGEELTDPLVQLGYQWDHLINDCQDTRAAVSLARRSLPQVMPRCQSVSEPFAASGA
jgi:hypothetical protein